MNMTNHLDVVEPKLPRFADMLRFYDSLEDWEKTTDEIVEILTDQGVVKKDCPILQPYSALYHAMLRCQPDRPLWHLDEDATKLLLSTSLPFELLEHQLPKLPFPGLYVTIPPHMVELEAVVKDAQGKTREVKGVPYEGFYLLQDFFHLEGNDWRPAITVIPIAYSTSPQNAFFYPITVPSGSDGHGQSLISRVDLEMYLDFVGGKIEIFRVAMNLLLALEGRYLQSEERREMRRRHASTMNLGVIVDQPYTIIHLTQVGRQRLAELETEGYEPGEGVSPRAHMRSEHWHSYWVRDPDGATVLATKERPRRSPLYLVPRRVREHKVGEGPIRRPLYLVKE